MLFSKNLLKLFSVNKSNRNCRVHRNRVQFQVALRVRDFVAVGIHPVLPVGVNIHICTHVGNRLQMIGSRFRLWLGKRARSVKRFVARIRAGAGTLPARVPISIWIDSDASARRVVRASRLAPHSAVSKSVLVTVGIHVEHDVPRDVVEILGIAAACSEFVDQLFREVDHCDGTDPLARVRAAVHNDMLRSFSDFHCIQRPPLKK
jgi:hypothetical protein